MSLPEVSQRSEMFYIYLEFRAEEGRLTLEDLLEISKEFADSDEKYGPKEVYELIDSHWISLDEEGGIYLHGAPKEVIIKD